MDQLAPTVTHKQKTTTASKRMLNAMTPVRAYNTAGTALALLNETLPNKKNDYGISLTDRRKTVKCICLYFRLSSRKTTEIICNML